MSSDEDMFVECHLFEEVDNQRELVTSMMCQNCHQLSSFEECPEIDVTALPYYFEIEMVDKEEMRFGRKFCNILKSQYDDEDAVSTFSFFS